MSVSTLLLYTKTTGHVLAAATAVAPASAEIKPEDLAGETFPVRYAGNPASAAFAVVRSAIPASELAVVTVDSQAAPISQIHTIIVNPQDKTPGSLDSSRTITSVTFSNNRTALAVTISTPLTAKASGMVRIERMSPSVPADPADIQLVKFEIAPGNPTTTNVQMQTVPVGSFSVMALVQGLRPYLSTI